MPHSAFDRRCPKYLEEKEIVTMKFTERISFREARQRYQATHPKRSYAAVVGEARPSLHSVPTENSNINQLISVLQSFGLRLATDSRDQRRETPNTTPQAAPACTEAVTQTSPTGAEEVLEPVHADREGDWTLVRGGRRPRPSRTEAPHARSVTPLTQSETTPPRLEGSAVLEALRRGEEERRAREAKRARLAENARESRRSSGASAESMPPTTRAPVPPAARAPQEGSLPPMRPPPPQPRPPPPPPPLGAPSDPRPPLVAPPAPTDRPQKRQLPWEASPTGVGSPRSRQKFQPGSTRGRASSADGRRPVVHTPIKFSKGQLRKHLQTFL